MVATINENIRWYKANDPYYYEVDNLPLIDLVQNDKDLRDRLNLLILDSTQWVNSQYVQAEVQDAVGNAGIINVNGEGGTMPNNVIDWVLGLGYVKISDIDLTAYVTHTYLNGLNYIDDVALAAYGYATSAWVDTQGFATQSWVNSLNHATQDWVTGKNYATENWVEQKGYIGDAELRQFKLSEIVMLKQEGWNNEPLSIYNSTLSYVTNYQIDRTVLETYMGLAAGSLKYLSHYIVRVGMNNGSGTSRIDVREGPSGTRRLLHTMGASPGYGETWVELESIISAQTPNTNATTFTISNKGTATPVLQIVGYVITRRIQAVLDD
tara:strand:- start:108 stop:1079 length:972 start_codon:yes stop_codon:yes gene_type:complete